MMKAYFINPPAAHGVRQVREGRCMQRAGAWTTVWTPISLALCAAVARREGAVAKLSDCIVEDISHAALAELARQFEPDLVVMNAVTPAIESDLDTVEIIKSVCPAAKVGVIGIHPTSLPDHCFSLAPRLDFAVRGEPEDTVGAITAAVRDGRSLEGVRGLSVRVNGDVRHGPDRPFVENLDDLPLPAWDLIDRRRYIMPFTDEQFLLVATGRGCPFDCTFCADSAYYGKKLRLRSPGSVVTELERNTRQFGTRHFLFWSESFTMNRRFAKDVSREMLRRDVRVKWVCNSRVDHVDEEMMRLFKKSGCTMIGFGVESGSQEVLDGIRKRTTLDQAREAVRLCHDAGIEVVAHSVLGFPCDTRETILETIEFMKDLRVDFAQFYCAVPFPGSELHETARANGWINTDDWTMFEQNFSVLDMPNLRAADIMELRRKAYRDFYMRPIMVLRTLRRLRTVAQVRNFVEMVRGFLTWV